MNDSPQFDRNAFEPDATASAELLALCERVCSEEITTSEFERLQQLLAGDSTAREFYLNYLGLHGALSWDANNPIAEEIGPAEPPASIDALLPAASLPLGELPDDRANDGGFRPPAGTLFSFLWPLGRVQVAGLLLTAALLLAAGFLYFRDDALRFGPLDKPIAVARLQEDHGCVWGGTTASLTVSDELGSGQKLELREGVAKLLFHNGATAVIEGPALFELVAGDSMRLDRGTVAVRSDGNVKEFIVTSPKASIIDLGTSFGVHCSEDGDTEVEVFEGAVEVRPQGNPNESRVLGVGGAAQVRRDGEKSTIDVSASEVDRFQKVLELLWAEMSRSDKSEPNEDGRALIQAEFNDAPIPGTIDTFYGAVRGRGWLTPWVASGNPIADVQREDSQFGQDDPVLRLRFYRSRFRTIAREYGTIAGFDPAQPHVISWRWRLNGNFSQFTKDYDSRVQFYGNPSFRRSSFETNSWLIGVVGGNETAGDRRRKFFPMRWYAYDAKDGGQELHRPNLVDSGMTLTPHVVYQFAVAVYPQEARYDVAIRDDEKTFIRTGLSFRSRSKAPANVIHFGICTDRKTDDIGFSLDSVRIEPLPEGGLSAIGNLEQ